MPALPVGIQEWAGGAGPGHGAGLLAAQLTTPGATMSDVPDRERKKLLEGGSTMNSIGQLGGAAIGGALGATLGGGDTIGSDIWSGVGGASTGALIGGTALPAVNGWWQGRKKLKPIADEKAEATRAHNERIENRAMKRDPDLKTAEFWATELAEIKRANLSVAGMDNEGMRTRMGYHRWLAQQRMNGGHVGRPPGMHPEMPLDTGGMTDNGMASPGSPTMSGTATV